MQLDPRALHIRTDGSCYRERRMISGCAAIVEYPDHMNRDPEQILDFGCSESSVNRMELLAVICSLQWIRKNRPWPGVTRVQVISDSRYVVENAPRALIWRSNGWRNHDGHPIENTDLWKQFITARSQAGMLVHIQWTAGKKSADLRQIDKAAKRAAQRGGPDTDYGYSRGAISRSKVKGAATAFDAHGQTAVIRPYRKNVMRRTGGENKVRFDVYSDDAGAYMESCYAFAAAEVAYDLHRQHNYRVEFNADPKYPRILKVLNEVATRQECL